VQAEDPFSSPETDPIKDGRIALASKKTNQQGVRVLLKNLPVLSHTKVTTQKTPVGGIRKKCPAPQLRIEEPERYIQVLGKHLYRVEGV
jgi:hypothetical protein